MEAKKREPLLRVVKHAELSRGRVWGCGSWLWCWH